jgi:hypothetical protein
MELNVGFDVSLSDVLDWKEKAGQVTTKILVTQYLASVTLTLTQLGFY